MDVDAMYVELQESLKRVVTLMLRSFEFEMSDALMQWCIILSNLMKCCRNIKQGIRTQIPGVTRQHLQILIDALALQS